VSLRAVVATAILIAVVALQSAPAIAVPQATAPPQLVDQTGRAFTLESLRGRVLVVTFVSAHCTDACPLVNAQFSDAAQRIASHGLSARLLTITLDPQHDPPSLMRALANRFQANPRYWLVASGRPRDVDAIVRAFGVVARVGKSGYREEHTTFVYVFDSTGKLNKTMLASSGLSGDIVDAVGTMQHRTGK
jgi:cytochrome oxidase Cu insertion factor (SCO1/SenC/PrrC family)